MHGLLWWAIVGLVSGLLAKAIMPGPNREPQGCLLTIALGIAGSLFAGWLKELIFGESGGGGTIGTIIGATIGAVILIWLFRKLWR